MNKQQIFSTFSSAISALAKPDYLSSGAMCTAVDLSALIKSSQRFYLPDVPDQLAGKKAYEYSDLIILPYDSLSILTITHGSPAIVHAKRAGNNDYKIYEGDGIEILPKENDYIVNISIFNRDNKVWYLVPFSGYLNDVLKLIPKIDKSVMSHIESVDEFNATVKASVEFLTMAVMLTSSLCVMLGLKNVKAKEEKPSRMRQQMAGKKKPLYSYHVLDVDGELWDGGHESTGEGAGKRSHLRRGHIRRLPKGAVWVRPTMVNGSVKGFVAKDYNVVAA